MTAHARPLPTFADVDAAAARIAGIAVRTPLINAPVLDERLGARVFLKAETLQRTGSFKFRGAYNKCSSIPPDKRAAGVVAYSSGNHAQGVAAAAKLLGMRATIVMPADAPRRSAGAPKRSAPRSSPTTATREDRAAIAAQYRRRARRDSGAALRRSADRRGAGHDRPRDRRGSGRAGVEARDRVYRHVGRRARRRHRARHQGRRAGSANLRRRAGRLRRHLAVVSERQARDQCPHERLHLRRADERDARAR